MAENINIKPFGLNVLPSADKVTTGTKQVGKSVENALGNLWEPVLNYLKENENVFTGEVFEEIKKTNLQAFQTAAILRESEPEKRLDTKM